MSSMQNAAVSARMDPDAAQARGAQPPATPKSPAAVMDAIGTRVRNAKRSARKKLFAAEDMLDTAAIRLRRRPWRSLGLALVAGAAAGVLATVLRSRGCAETATRDRQNA